MTRWYNVFRANPMGWHEIAHPYSWEHWRLVLGLWATGYAQGFEP